MKHTLAENMLRFGVKNLSESNVKKIEKLTEQAIGTPQQTTQTTGERFNEAMSFDDLLKNGTIKIGVTVPNSDFNVIQGPGFWVYFRDPIVWWDGQSGLVYAKTHTTQYGQFPDPESPAGIKQRSEYEAKINSSKPVLTPIQLVGNTVRTSKAILPKFKDAFSLLQYAAKYLNGEGLLDASKFMKLTGFTTSLPKFLTQRSLDADIKSGRFGDVSHVAKNKDLLIRGFGIPATAQ